MKFKVGDIVEVINFDGQGITEGVLKKGHVGKITSDNRWSIGVSPYDHLYKVDERWNFYSVNLELLDHQERLNRKYIK